MGKQCGGGLPLSHGEYQKTPPINGDLDPLVGALSSRSCVSVWGRHIIVSVERVWLLCVGFHVCPRRPAVIVSVSVAALQKMPA